MAKSMTILYILFCGIHLIRRELWKTSVVSNISTIQETTVRLLGIWDNWSFPKCSNWIQWQKYLSLQKKGSSLPPVLLKTKMSPRCQQETDRIFKLTPTNALVIYPIPWVYWISVKSREYSIESNDLIARANEKWKTNHISCFSLNSTDALHLTWLELFQLELQEFTAQ